METGPISGSNRAASMGPARAGRRRLGAREGSAVEDGHWSWLASLGTGPIRLTPENVIVAIAVRWLGGFIVRGRFMDVRGTNHVPAHEVDTAAVTVEVLADSVRTGISLRTEAVDPYTAVGGTTTSLQKGRASRPARSASLEPTQIAKIARRFDRWCRAAPW